jgi:hypothetical protein
LIEYLEILSAWEITQRWHGIDPDDTEAGNIPGKVKD